MSIWANSNEIARILLDIAFLNEAPNELKFGILE